MGNKLCLKNSLSSYSFKCALLIAKAVEMYIFLTHAPNHLDNIKYSHLQMVKKKQLKTKVNDDMYV